MATPLVFASGCRQGGNMTQGGTWGYVSGDLANTIGNTLTGGGVAGSTPHVADDDPFLYITVTTTAPTAQTCGPPNSGGFIGVSFNPGKAGAAVHGTGITRAKAVFQ